ncbi:hypothetical protein FRB96_009284 [Tulasnella sp. 330]|nr:hypothetical protein FRB96_009284 [Tulasnella sp. 330]KAG8880868.1 hypothetical protein FRB97_000378 [Tulasnella sp. 331]KAG8887106.1 hypothetical protein FRB98_000576 [Tulasnella sp. 332]
MPLKPLSAVRLFNRSGYSSRPYLLSCHLNQQQLSYSKHVSPGLPASPPSSDGVQSHDSGLGSHISDKDKIEFTLQPNYIQPTAHVASVFVKGFAYVGVTIISLGIAAFLGFEGAHLYVEYAAIPAVLAENNEDVVWGWGSSGRESWTGVGGRGGTDPALGYKTRHLLRAAWMAQHWGAGIGSQVDKNGVPKGTASGGTGYHLAEQFLAGALKQAELKSGISSTSSTSLSSTFIDLITLHARVLERLGSDEGISRARADYIRLWASLSNDVHSHAEAAQVAIKIGDLSGRLNDGEMAEEWWQRALEYATLSGGETKASSRPGTAPPSTVPALLPPSPLAQRSVVSALVSLSGYYATTQRFDQAQAVEQSALQLLSASATQKVTGVLDLHPSAPSSSSRSAPGTLHSLFMQHRSSILSIHLAEVLYARRSNTPKPRFSRRKTEDIAAPSQVHLHLAATTSEKVAFALTDVTEPYSSASSAFTRGLAPIYAQNASLARPAGELLRDSRRTAAEAWNLSGLLYELEGRTDTSERALECFERAVHWAGGQDALREESDTDIMRRDWKTYWENYSRAKDRMNRSGK